VNAAVAPTREEAVRLAQPNLLSMVTLRTGGHLTAQPLVEEAEERGIPEQHRSLAEQMLERWVIGTPDEAAEQVAKLAADHAVDEVMLHPVAGALSGTPAGQSPAREATLRLLAAALG
jgi:alkanesulfonate monooxygenase SsuD/methylene tetrahydromethanopterin reductase-like flavin-dependent oxidoreductase (luciferase family)